MLASFSPIWKCEHYISMNLACICYSYECILHIGFHNWEIQFSKCLPNFDCSHHNLDTDVSLMTQVWVLCLWWADPSCQLRSHSVTLLLLPKQTERTVRIKARKNSWVEINSLVSKGEGWGTKKRKKVILKTIHNQHQSPRQWLFSLCLIAEQVMGYREHPLVSWGQLSWLARSPWLWLTISYPPQPPLWGSRVRSRDGLDTA